MYDKVVIMRRYNDPDGKIRSVTLGLFDRNGVLQLEVPQISGKLVPIGATAGQEVIFAFPGLLVELKKE